jgi:hypothetical protein
MVVSLLRANGQLLWFYTYASLLQRQALFVSLFFSRFLASIVYTSW